MPALDPLPRRLAPSCAALSVALAVLASAGAPAPARAVPVVAGIGEQNARMFASPRFAALGIDHVRYTFPWDGLEHDWQVEETDAYMKAAERAGADVLVVFAKSRVRARSRILPRARAYRASIRAFLDRYPQVHEIAAWNEPNHRGQPTARSPRALARFYDVARQECGACTVLPGTVLDTGTMERYTRAAMREIRRRGAPAPVAWGLHNYGDAHLLRTRRTAAFAALVGVPVWLAETGSLVYYTGDGVHASRFPRGRRHQVQVVRFLFDEILPAVPQVARIYLYQWRVREAATWDSGLLTPAGRPRPAYFTLRRALSRTR